MVVMMKLETRSKWHSRSQRLRLSGPKLPELCVCQARFFEAPLDFCLWRDKYEIGATSTLKETSMVA
jgi:hypothetical protein